MKRVAKKERTLWDPEENVEEVSVGRVGVVILIEERQVYRERMQIKHSS
jgi:hypothetical protein